MYNPKPIQNEQESQLKISLLSPYRLYSDDALKLSSGILFLSAKPKVSLQFSEIEIKKYMALIHVARNDPFRAMNFQSIKTSYCYTRAIHQNAPEYLETQHTLLRR